MKPSEFIQRGWCQNVSALDEQGRAVSAYDPMACRWCLSGALTAAYPDEVEKRINIHTQIVKKLKEYATAWNDREGRTQAEVVALLQSVGE